MIRKLSYILPAILFVLLSSANTFGQCAMCRTTVENNVSNGDATFAAGLNVGILYLFLAPYLAFAVVAFFWYRISKRNAKKKFKQGLIG